MKKLNLIMALCLPLALAVSSCQKDDATTTPDSSGSGGATGKALTKIAEVGYSKHYSDYTPDYTSGSCGSLELRYSNGLITHVEDVYWGSEGEERIPYDVNYDANGHLVSISNGEETITPEVTYDADGHITCVYITYSSSWERITFTWENGMIIRKTEESSHDNTPDITNYRWENGNMVEQVWVGSDQRETYTYVYDSHPNYMTSYGQLPFIMGMEKIICMSKNNVIQRTRTVEYVGSSSSSTSYSYIYTYGSDGYPVSFREVRNNNNQGGYYTEYNDVTYLTYADGSGTTAPTLYRINVNKNNNDAGWQNGGGYYEYGATVIIKADNNYGYRFVRWNDGNTDNPRTFFCTGEASYTAIYEAN